MGDFFNNLGAKFQSFMIGRNGPDKLGTWAIGLGLVIAIVNVFLPNIVCSVVSYALLFYSIYRMFSRNVSARRLENEKFEALLSRLTGGRAKSGGAGGRPDSTTQTGPAKGSAKAATSPDPSKVTFKCEQCGQSLSVPKGRGTLKVTCPKCHHQQRLKS